MRIPVRIVELGYEQVTQPTSLAYQAAAPESLVQTGQLEITARVEAIFEKPSAKCERLFFVCKKEG
jgi:hypothetical protein